MSFLPSKNENMATHDVQWRAVKDLTVESWKPTRKKQRIENKQAMDHARKTSLCGARTFHGDDELENGKEQQPQSRTSRTLVHAHAHTNPPLLRDKEKSVPEVEL